MSENVLAYPATEILDLPLDTAEYIPRRKRKPAPDEEKTLKILFIGDPHFDDDNMIETNLLEERVVRLIKLHNVDTAVVLGDTLHRHGTTEASTRAAKFLTAIHQLTKVVLLIGNHDMMGPRSYMDGIHDFNAYKGWNNLIVVDKAMNFTIGHLLVIGVPYVYKGRFHEALQTQELDYQKADLILAHQEFYGILGPHSDNGDQWTHNSPLVVSGHIHNYSWHSGDPAHPNRRENKNTRNILYTGSPMMTTYGERQSKTVSLFTYEGESAIPTETRYNLDIPPRVTVELPAGDVATWKIPHEFLEMPITHRRLKLFISGTSEEIAALRKSGRISYFEREGVRVDTRPQITTPKSTGLASIEELKRSLWDIDASTTRDGSSAAQQIQGARIYQLCLNKHIESEETETSDIYVEYNKLLSKLTSA